MSKRALLIGINEFQGRPDWLLRGCVNDSQTMAEMLRSYYAFTGEEIRILRDSEATAQAIHQHLAWLLSGYAGDGSDVRLLHFASHGTQLPMTGDDVEDDGLDEVIVPYDHDWNKPFRDDDLWAYFSQVPHNVAFTFIADCCHSGTINRLPGEDAIPRYAAPPAEVEREINRILAAQERSMNEWVEAELAEALAEVPFVERDGVRASLRERLMAQFRSRFSRPETSQITPPGHVLLAACQDDQTAADALIEGMYRGAFTWSLLTALAEHGGQLSYSDLLTRSRQLLVNYTQNPQIDADPASRQRPFLAPVGG
jgi:hypothetical protein